MPRQDHKSDKIVKSIPGRAKHENTNINTHTCSHIYHGIFCCRTMNRAEKKVEKYRDALHWLVNSKL